MTPLPSPRSRWRPAGEDGFTLIELLVATVLAVLVLGAILTLSDVVGNRSVANGRVTDAEDTARAEIDRLVRTIRDAPPVNAAAPAGSITPIAVARQRSLIVASADPVGSWVRYCTDGVALRRGRLTGALIDPGTSCPAAAAGGWIYSTIFAEGVLNPDSMFSYDSCPGVATLPCTASTVRSIGVTVRVSVGQSRSIRLSAAVTPRNRG